MLRWIFKPSPRWIDEEQDKIFKLSVEFLQIFDPELFQPLHGVFSRRPEYFSAGCGCAKRIKRAINMDPTTTRPNIVLSNEVSWLCIFLCAIFEKCWQIFKHWLHEINIRIYPFLKHCVHNEITEIVSSYHELPLRLSIILMISL